MGMIACPNCGMQVNADAAGCQNCGADPKTGVVPEWVEAHADEFGSTPQQSGTTWGSQFIALPSTLLGRVSVGLFLVGLVVWVVGISLPHGTNLKIGPVDPVAVGLVVGFCGAIVTGAVALIGYHERSWAVWVSTLLVVLLMTAEMVSAVIGG